MHVVVETWKARPVWRNSPPAERAAYLDAVVSVVAELLAGGVELMAGGLTDQTRDIDYWAVWRFRNRDHATALARAMDRIGWHDRFEPVDIGVEARTSSAKKGKGVVADVGGFGGQLDVLPRGQRAEQLHALERAAEAEAGPESHPPARRGRPNLPRGL